MCVTVKHDTIWSSTVRLVTTTLERHPEHMQKLVFFLSVLGNDSFRREETFPKMDFY